jgi:excisionase family DNA binding protein
MEYDPAPTENPYGERKTSDHPDRLLTIGQVAELTGLTVGSLYHFVSERRIPVVRLSRRCLRFRYSALLTWWDSLTQAAKPSERHKGRKSTKNL